MAATILAPPRSKCTRSGWSAFVIRSGRVETRAIRIGHLGGMFAEVLSGIDVADEIVMFPSDQVKAGIKVKGQTA